jgi:hypothetical protein
MATSVYFFKGNSYARYGTGEEKVDPGYPQPVSTLPGVVASDDAVYEFERGFDCVVNWGNGKAYMFLAAKYLRFDIAGNKVDAVGRIDQDWPGTAGLHIGGDFGPRIEAAMNMYNGKAYLFLGNKYLRYDVAANAVDPGYPKPIAGNWPGLDEAGCGFPTAAVNWGNGKAYFFQGNQYVRYDLAADKVDDGYPKQIAGNWPGVVEAGFASGLGLYGITRWGNTSEYLFHIDNYLRYATGPDAVDQGYPKPIDGHWQGLREAGFAAGFDAAIKWPNGKLYFFRDDSYLAYDIAADAVDSGYPRTIAADWPGMSNAGFAAGIHAALPWWNGKAYFFKGDQYVRYDISANSVDAGYPKPIAGNWPGMSEAGFGEGIDAAVNWWNGKVFFFKGDQYVRYDISADTVDAGYPKPIAGSWPGMSEAGFGDNIAAAVEVDGLGTGRRFVFKKPPLLIDPLALLLRHDIYIDLTLPDPPPDGVLLERLQKEIAGLSVDERALALARVEALADSAALVQRQLE